MEAQPVEVVTIQDTTNGDWILERFDDDSLLVSYQGEDILPEDPSVLKFEEIDFDFYCSIRDRIRGSSGWELTTMFGVASRVEQEMQNLPFSDS